MLFKPPDDERGVHIARTQLQLVPASRSGRRAVRFSKVQKSGADASFSVAQVRLRFTCSIVCLYSSKLVMSSEAKHLWLLRAVPDQRRIRDSSPATAGSE